MAQLRDTVISGSLRATDTIYTNKIQTSIIGAPTSSNGTTFGVGTNGQVLKSNGTSVYWASDSAGVTSVRVQATSPVTSSVNTAQTGSLDTTIALANNYGDTKNPYASKTKNTVLAAPATADGVPSFRALVADDIPTISAAKASLGNVSNNANLNSTTGAKGDIIYWSATNTPAHLTNTSSTTKQFLSITSQVPAWSAVSKGDVGLGNVDNTSDANKPISTATQTALNAKLPIAGGTMTGTLTLKANQYEDSHSGALNANNSNIYNLNSIYTSDASDGAAEGIHFYRDSTHVDSLWANGGDLLFVPNRELGTNTNKANSEKVARLPATVTNNQFVLTDGTTGKLKTKALTSQDIARPTGLRGFDDPTLQSLVSKVRANRLAFLPGDQIIIEKTTDGGTTWVDAGVSDDVKSQIFSDASTGGVSLPLIDGVRNLKCGLRITITAMKYNVPAGTPETEKYNYWNVDHLPASGYQERYCTLKDFYFYISSSADSMGIKIERSNGKADHTWVTAFDDSSFYMTGWSGVDYVRIPQSTFGGASQTGNYWNYRFTFMTKGQNGTTTMGGSATQAQGIYQINAYGDNVWTSSNPLMAHDHMYSFDRLKNVTFPAGVSAVGPINFANNTWNTVGDDVHIGDRNIAGALAIQGINGTTGLRLIAKGATGTGGASITWDGTDLSLNGYTVKKSVPSDAKFTDTTYTAASAAPGKIVKDSAQGTSTNYARQDHTHGIDVGTGDANGQVKIAGQNTSVKGLAALAYKASLTESDIPELNASKITAGTLPVSRGGTGTTSFTANSVIMSGSTTTAALTTRAITDNSSNADVTSSDTNLITGRTLYYQLAKKGYLTSHQTINQDSVTGAIINRYAICSTAASTAAKTASIKSGTFTLGVGATVRVTFTYSNTATNPTLNINSTGAKPIYKFGTTTPGTTPEDSWSAGEVVTLVFDGIGWQMSSNPIMGLTASQVANLFNLIG